MRDSDLDLTAKAIAHTIGTYMNAAGEAWPSKAKIAAGCSVAVDQRGASRTVDRAIRRLVGAGLLEVRPSRGRAANRYQATFPTPSPAPGFDSAQPRRGSPPTPSPAPGELERKPAAAPSKSAPHAIVDDCMACGARTTVAEVDGRFLCADCTAEAVTA